VGFEEEAEEFSMDRNFSPRTADLSKLESRRAGYFKKAEREARKLRRRGEMSFVVDADEIESLKNFYYVMAAPAPRPKRTRRA
jgi:hypothetical protein